MVSSAPCFSRGKAGTLLCTGYSSFPDIMGHKASHPSIERYLPSSATMHVHNQHCDIYKCKLNQCPLSSSGFSNIRRCGSLAATRTLCPTIKSWSSDGLVTWGLTEFNIHIRACAESHCHMTLVYQFDPNPFSKLGLWNFLTKQSLVLHSLSIFVLWFRRLLSRFYICMTLLLPISKTELKYLPCGVTVQFLIQKQLGCKLKTEIKSSLKIN